MHTFEQKAKATRQANIARLVRPGRIPAERNCEVNFLLHLQRTIGNQAAQRVLEGNSGDLKGDPTTTGTARLGHDSIQIPIHPPSAEVASAMETKLALAISKPGVEYEQEADRVADHLMRMPVPQRCHTCLCGGQCAKILTRQPLQEAEGLDTKRTQASDTGQAAIPPNVHEALAAPGEPLDPLTHSFMEKRFGHDFSGVRLHIDSRAAESARALNARAYTVGHNIVFGRDQFAPETYVGRKLLAHELTHVIQQCTGVDQAGTRGMGLMCKPGAVGIIQRSPYEAQVLSLQEIAADPAKERLRKQSGQTTAKVCRSIGRDLTPDNCPTLLPTGETVTVMKEKVAGLWLQIECAGMSGFGPQEQCHILGAFARRLEPPKAGGTPQPERPERKQPPAETEPKPQAPAQPEVPVPKRDGCTETTSREISRAIEAAQQDLSSAIAALTERPLAPVTLQALWLSLRTASENDATSAVAKFQSIVSQLSNAEISCDDPGLIFCPGNTKGYVNPITGTIHLCSQSWSTADDVARERAVIHEAIHAFAGTSGVYELYHSDDCSEGDVAGQGRSFRLQNTDSLACLVILLTHSAETDLEPRVQHSKGEDLTIRQKPAGDISLDADPQSAQFELVGYDEIGISRIRWIFRDSEGQRYLLRTAYGEEIISPDDDTDYVRGIFIGAKTRALLKDRGVSDLEMIVRCNIPEVGEKVNRINVHVVP
jgi:hypothetical protein